MTPHESHLSDSQLVSAIDGELSQKDNILAQAHLAACWSCRARRQELESAIADFVRVHRERLDGTIPPEDGPRALLKARMAQLESAHGTRSPRLSWLHSWRTAFALATTVLVLAASLYLARRVWSARHSETLVAVIKPDPNLTPGATVLLSRGELCRESNTNNKAVPVSLQRRIFDEYGIHTRRVNSYEVDYLITPALGGADDIHNLWPQSRSATAWNAEVKDALEDHLRHMVCEGQIDLTVAQREMAADWIQAYKKYFHTDRPLTRYP
ncbi:MAG TPA: hypothetical protein VKX25_13610 [Bryobacteraceae bacterium]|jgi:hypothetical protein|nr:hypothetical protein [Bryobacteraceae bacterium]